jgi:hypothetical protein
VVAHEDLGGPRKLVLVRRDNVEHLLVIGGSTDFVVEQNIVRAPQREAAVPRGPLAADAGRPAPDATWSESESRSDILDPYEAQPAPEPPTLRPPRSSLGDEARRPAPPSMPDRAPLFPERAAPERSRDPLAGFTPEPPPRPEPRPEPRIEMPSRPVRQERSEPPLRPDQRAPARNEVPSRSPRMQERMPERAPTAPPQNAPLSAADQNLAEMAQRLEAALRRPAPDASEGAPPVAPEAPTPRASRPAPPPPAASAGPAEPKAEKNPFENLEDEMASLLGRAKPPA